MSIFMCDNCGCIENTATSNFWFKEKRALCSECDPKIGKWHNIFDKRPAKGMMLGEDGYLYNEKPHHTKIVSIIK